MKKNTLLYIGLAAAAVLFIAMRRRRSSVEAGPTEKITAEEFEMAEVVEPSPTIKPVKPQAIVDVLKSLKRTQAQKEAAKKRKALKKQPKAAAAIKTFLSAPRVMRGVDDISVLY